jgi:hypothetical protein
MRYRWIRTTSLLDRRGSLLPRLRRTACRPGCLLHSVARSGVKIALWGDGHEVRPWNMRSLPRGSTARHACVHENIVHSARRTGAKGGAGADIVRTGENDEVRAHRCHQRGDQRRRALRAVALGGKVDHPAQGPFLGLSCLSIQRQLRGPGARRADRRWARSAPCPPHVTHLTPCPPLAAPSCEQADSQRARDAWHTATSAAAGAAGAAAAMRQKCVPDLELIHAGPRLLENSRHLGGGL